jgi:HD-GYP domain-containing protein (c-di-GMP phosphodiesterase class II)
MRGHTFYTYRILESVKGLEQLAEWAAYHHERLDGKGYPFHHTDREMAPGARIMAVADVFTAVCEDRPYRKGMEQPAVTSLLRNAARSGWLDPQAVQVLLQNYRELDHIRQEEQATAAEVYREFRTYIASLDEKPTQVRRR